MSDNKKKKQPKEAEKNGSVKTAEKQQVDIFAQNKPEKDRKSQATANPKAAEKKVFSDIPAEKSKDDKQIDDILKKTVKPSSASNSTIDSILAKGAPTPVNPVSKSSNNVQPSADKAGADKSERGGYSHSNGGLNVNYLTKMGFKSLINYKSMTISSVSVLTACLLLIGVSLMILFNIQTMVKQVESQNVVVAFLEDDLDKETVEYVGNALSEISNVSHVELVSKEEAFSDQLESFGIEASSFINIIDNPLPDSYNVTVLNVDSFSSTLEKIRNVEHVSSVRESQELVGQIAALQKSVSAICAVIVILLFVVSLFIITNTIRITMVSRKIDISVMKSVGATNSFVRWPFIIEGIAIGVISALIALGLTYLVDRLEGDAFSSLITLFGGTTVSVFEHWPILISGYTVGGIVVGLFGSIISMAKYLRKEGSAADEI